MFLLPIGHEELSVRRLPWVTIGIALVCVAVQLVSCTVEDRIEGPLVNVSREMRGIVASVEAACSGECPDDITAALKNGEVGTYDERMRFLAADAQRERLLSRHPVYGFGFRPDRGGVLKMLTYVFVHGGWVHLIGNMLFLYLVGTTIEDRWGRWRFLLFYMLGGVAAAVAYLAAHKGSPMPLVGASGAIAAAMGGFAILYARTRIRFAYLWWFFVLRAGTFSAPAWLVLPLWFLEQLLSISLETSGLDNVGYSAHAGGFVFGALAAGVIRLAGFDKRFSEEIDAATGGWVQDPLMAEATALADKHQERAALAKLAELLARNPGHHDARELAFDLAIRTHNQALAERHGAALFAEWVGKEPNRVLEGQRKIVQLAGEGPVDERVLMVVLRAAEALKDIAAGEDVLRRTYRHRPDSAQIPRMLWGMAAIYGGAARVDLEHRCLERLVQDHAGTTWGDKARARLQPEL